MSSDSPPPPVTNNYQETMREALRAQIDLAPELYQAEMGQTLNPETGEYEDTIGGGSRLDYAKLERSVMADNLYGDENSIVTMLAGDKKMVKPDGSLAKPGYDATGTWRGTAQLEEDMRYAQQKSQVEGDIGLVKDNQKALTDALRGGANSALNQSINRAKTKLQLDSGAGRIKLTPKDHTQAIENLYNNATDEISGSDFYSQPISNVRTAKTGISADTDFTPITDGGLIRRVGTNEMAVRDLGTNNKYERIGNQDAVSARDITAGSIGAGAVSAKEIKTRDGTTQNISSRDVNAQQLSSSVDAGQVGDLGGLRSALSSQAMNDLSLGGSLSPEARRQIEEDARASAVARGRGRDTASIVDEVANMEGARRQRENERRQFAQGVAGQEAQLRQVDMGQSMQAQEMQMQADMANQSVDLQGQLSNQASSLQAQQANQQANLQQTQANLSNELRAQELNQASGLRAQEINQANAMQASQANVSNNLRAQELNQAKDMQVGMDQQARQLSAQQANQQANLSANERYQQGQLAQVARDQALQDRNLQAELANQQVDSAEVARSMDVQKTNADLQVRASELGLQAGMAEAERLQSENALKVQRDVAEAQRMQGDNQQKMAVDQYNAQLSNQRASALAQNISQQQDKQLQAGIFNQQQWANAVAMDRAAALNEVQMEQATSADAMLALTGRPSGQTQTIGQSSFGSQGALSGAGPKLYNPAQGAEFMANQSSMINNYNASTYGADQAMTGAIIGGVASGLGAIGGGFASRGCWVAREIYGADNPRWLMFRYWLFNEGPTWFKVIYLTFGEWFAKYIKDKPSLKSRIKTWMEKKIKEIEK
jgi:hypothetical protein